jgi:hypothetical protein
MGASLVQGRPHEGIDGEVLDLHDDQARGGIGDGLLFDSEIGRVREAVGPVPQNDLAIDTIRHGSFTFLATVVPPRPGPPFEARRT